MYCAMTERSSTMLSIEVPKKAVLKARKRQELSSGMIRRTIVEACDGRGNSGASSGDMFCFLVKDNGSLGLDGVPLALGDGGVVPTSAKEKFDSFEACDLLCGAEGVD